MLMEGCALSLIRTDDSPERRRHARLAAKGEMWMCFPPSPGFCPRVWDDSASLAWGSALECIRRSKCIDRITTPCARSARTHAVAAHCQLSTSDSTSKALPAHGSGDGDSVGENVAVDVAGARLLASSRPGTPYTYLDIPIWCGLPRIDSIQATLAHTAPTQTKRILAVDGWNCLASITSVVEGVGWTQRLPCATDGEARKQGAVDAPARLVDDALAFLYPLQSSGSLLKASQARPCITQVLYKKPCPRFGGTSNLHISARTQTTTAP